MNIYMIKKEILFRLFLVFLTSAVLSCAGNRAEVGPEQGSAPIVIESSSDDFVGIGNARNRVLAYFNRVDGSVENVDNGSALIRVTGQTRLIKGMRFSVFRDGGIFHHPVTNEPIGSSDEYIGRMEVTDDEPADGLYLCAILHGGISAGDKIRITSSRIKLAFFQDRSSEWTISELFYDALNKTGRFEILESFTSTYEPEVLSEIARKLGAEAVLLFSTSSVKKSNNVHIKLYWAEDASMFSQINEPLTQETVEVTPDNMKAFPASPGKEGLQKIYELDGGHLFAVGDADGDGRENVVIGDSNNVIIYAVNDVLKKMWSVKGPGSGNILSIDMLDANNNGRQEMFVTVLVKNSQIRSFVIEYDPERGFHKVAQNIPYFLRVTGNSLLMQKFGQSRTFSGPVYEGTWRDGTYRTGNKLKLFDDVNIYGFTYVDLHGTGQSQLISIDDKGFLTLYDHKGGIEWEGGRSFGKPEISFRREISSDMEYIEWFVRGRLMTMATDRKEALVVLNRIPASSIMPELGSRGGEVYLLWNENGVMQQKLIQKEIPGSITDYLIKDNNMFLISRGSTLSNIKNIASGKSKKSSLFFHFKLHLDELKSLNTEQEDNEG
jgi:hypothetical protein